MPQIDRANLALILLEDAVWVLVSEIGLPNYDFNLADRKSVV